MSGTLASMYLPSFERGLYDDAIRQHVHRSDVRDGMRRNVGSTASSERDDASQVQGSSSFGPEGDSSSSGGPVIGPIIGLSCSDGQRVLEPSSPASPSPPPSRQAGRRPRARGGGDGATDEGAKDKWPEYLTGTVDLELEAPGGAVGPIVRCGLSACFNSDWPVHLVHKYLRKSNWRRSAKLEIIRPSAPVPLVPLSHGGGDGPRLAAQRATHAEPERSLSPPRSPPPTWHGGVANGVLRWSFVRHIPGGDLIEFTLDGAKLKGTSGAGMSAISNIDPRLLEILFSDITALLESCGEHGVAPSAQEVVNLVPGVTRARWSRSLKIPPESSEDALAKRIARTLATKADWFRVRTAQGTYLGADSVVTLLGESQPKEPNSNSAPAPGEAPDNPYMSGTNALRRKRVGRWLGFLPMAKELNDACKELGETWGIEMRLDRMEAVMASLERSISASLYAASIPEASEAAPRGALRARLASERDQPLGARRGADISTEWVILVIGEAVDEDHLEDGDSVHLLTGIAAEASGMKSFRKEAWAFICARLDANAAAANLLRRGLRAREAPPGKAEVNGDDAPRAKAADRKAYEAARKAILDRAESTASADACRPLVLEALLQLAASHNEGASSESSVLDLLWELCGWDSPAARRLLRRLCRAFNGYAKNGELSLSGFFKLCHDAGWSVTREIASKTNRFQIFFVDAVGFSDKDASFADFVRMIEHVIAQVLTPSSRMTDGLPVWQAMEVAVQRLGGGGAQQRGGAGRAAVTVRQKAREPRGQLLRPRAAPRGLAAAAAPAQVPGSPAGGDLGLSVVAFSEPPAAPPRPSAASCTTPPRLSARVAETEAMGIRTPDGEAGFKRPRHHNSSAADGSGGPDAFGEGVGQSSLETAKARRGSVLTPKRSQAMAKTCKVAQGQVQGQARMRQLVSRQSVSQDPWSPIGSLPSYGDGIGSDADGDDLPEHAEHPLRAASPAARLQARSEAEAAEAAAATAAAAAKRMDAVTGALGAAGFRGDAEKDARGAAEGDESG